MKKIISLILISVYLFNNIAYGLATMPGSEVLEVRQKALTIAQKRFLDERGPGSSFDELGMYGDDYQEKFHGGRKQDEVNIRKEYDAKFDADIPAEWEGKTLLQQTNLIDAFNYYMVHEAQIPEGKVTIEIGYFPVLPGELPIDVIKQGDDGKYKVIIHKDFARKWEMIDDVGDVRVNMNLQKSDETEPVMRTVSAKWGLFHWVATHIMADIDTHSNTLKYKSPGHLAFDPKDDTTTFEEDEANLAGGRYGIVNEAIKAWYLTVNFGNSTRCNNDIFKARLEWILDPTNPESAALELYKEFPTLMNDPDAMKFAISFACALNFEAYHKKINLTKGEQVLKGTEEELKAYLDSIDPKEMGTEKEAFRGGTDTSVELPVIEEEQGSVEKKKPATKRLRDMQLSAFASKKNLLALSLLLLATNAGPLQGISILALGGWGAFYLVFEGLPFVRDRVIKPFRTSDRYKTISAKISSWVPESGSKRGANRRPWKVLSMFTGATFSRGLTYTMTGVLVVPLCLFSIGCGGSDSAPANRSSKRVELIQRGISNLSGYLAQDYEDSQGITEATVRGKELELTFDLKANSKSNAKGEIYMDFGEVKNLNGVKVAVEIEISPEFLNDMGGEPNIVRIFGKDDDWKSQYSDVKRKNKIRKSGVVTIEHVFEDGSTFQGDGDTKFKADKVRLFGIKIETDRDSNYRRKGKVTVRRVYVVSEDGVPAEVKVDIKEEATPEPVVPVQKQDTTEIDVPAIAEQDTRVSETTAVKFGDMLDLDWKIQDHGDTQGVEAISKIPTGMVLSSNIDASSQTARHGEICVDIEAIEFMGQKIGPKNLTNTKFTGVIKVSSGFVTALRNGLQIFVKDRNGNGQYCGWVDIDAAGFIKVEYSPTKTDEGQGPESWTAEGFNMEEIVEVGFKFGTGDGSDFTYDGPLTVSGLKAEDIVTGETSVQAPAAERDLVPAEDTLPASAIEIPVEVSSPAKEEDPVSTRTVETPRQAVSTEEAAPLLPVERSVQETGDTIRGKKIQDDLNKPGRFVRQTYEDSQGVTGVTAKNDELEIDYKLDGTSTTHSKGETYLDLNRVENLMGAVISVEVYIPGSFLNSDTNKPNGIQIFGKDGGWRSQYGTWVNASREGWVTVTYSPLKDATPVRGDSDPGFDPGSIRLLGVKLGTNDNRSVYSGSAKGEVKVRNWKVTFPGEKTTATGNTWLDQSWNAEDGADCQGIRKVERTREGLKLTASIDAKSSHSPHGEVYLDLNGLPEKGPKDITGYKVTVKVKVPRDFISRDLPNGVQVFSKNGDAAGSAQYGSWVNLSSTGEIEIEYVASSNNPQAHMDPGYDPTKVVSVGIKFGTGDGSRTVYNGDGIFITDVKIEKHEGVDTPKLVVSKWKKDVPGPLKVVPATEFEKNQGIATYAWSVSYGQTIGGKYGYSRIYDEAVKSFKFQKSKGVNLIRIFTMCDLRSGVTFDKKTRKPISFSKNAAADFNALIRAADAAGVKLIITETDFHLNNGESGDGNGEHPEIVQDAETMEDFFDLLDEVLRKVKDPNNTVLAWEPMNEPELAKSLPHTQVYVTKRAERLRKIFPGKPVSFSMQKVEYLKYWRHILQPGDILQVHSYEAMDKVKRKDTADGLRSFDSILPVNELDIPEGVQVIIGEIGVKNQAEIDKAKAIAKERGYAGILVWMDDKFDVMTQPETRLSPMMAVAGGGSLLSDLYNTLVLEPIHALVGMAQTGMTSVNSYLAEMISWNGVETVANIAAILGTVYLLQRMFPAVGTGGRSGSAEDSDSAEIPLQGMRFGFGQPVPVPVPVPVVDIGVQGHGKDGKWLRKPGKSPEDTLTVIEETRLVGLAMEGGFTKDQYREEYATIEDEYGFTSLPPSDTQIDHDLKALVKGEVLTIDNTEKKYKYLFTKKRKAALEEDLPKIISEYKLRIRDAEGVEGPGASRKLIPGEPGKPGELQQIWQAIELARKTNIQVFYPQSVKLTKPVQQLLTALRQRGVVIHDTKYHLDKNNPTEEGLMNALANDKEKGAEAIVILDGKISQVLSDRLESPDNEADLELFRDVRMLPITVPKEFKTDEKEVAFQAQMFRAGILGRILKRGTKEYVAVSDQLTRLMEGSLAGSKVKPGEVVTQLAKEDNEGATVDNIRDRIRPFMQGGWVVNLVKQLEWELRVLKEFWTYA